MAAHYAIVGAGAVGGVIAAHLLAAGEQVTLVVRSQRLAEYTALEQLRLAHSHGEAEGSWPRPAISDKVPADATVVMLAVKHAALNTVLEALNGRLPAGATLLTCLNGIGVAEQVAERFPGHEVRHLTIMYNAAVIAPLHYRITTRPGVLLDGPRDGLFAALSQTGLEVAPGNRALTHGKLLINLNNALCALTRRSFRDMLIERDMRAMFIALVEEATAAMDAAEIPWQLPMPLPFNLYRLLVLYGGPLPWWIARRVNGLTGQAYPSMVADLDAGRPTEINELNGVISRLGAQAGVPVPLNDEIVKLVKALEQGKGDYFTPAELRRHLLSES